MERLPRYVCAAALLALFASLPALPFAQQSGEPAQEKNQILTRVDEVVVPVTVTDRMGQPVLDLSQTNFRVFDNGVEQTIDHWEVGGEPLAVVLVIETSSRIQAMARVIHSLSGIFTETVMAANGEAAVITYDSEVEIHQPFTHDHDAIGSAIAGVKFEVSTRHLYDGMAKAMELLETQQPSYRRIILIIGESQDDGSEARLGQVVRRAAQGNISIYAVGTSSVAADLSGNNGPAPLNVPGLPPITTRPCVDLRGYPCFDLATPTIWLLEMGTTTKIKKHELDVAAAATGGIHYSTFRDNTIQVALDRIGAELHAQYVLSYAPATAPRPGFNAIKVTVSRPDLTLRTRPGYYVLPSR
jgi:VWFA-related protein